MLFGTCSSAAAGIWGGGQGTLLGAQPWCQGGLWGMLRGPSPVPPQHPTTTAAEDTHRTGRVCWEASEVLNTVPCTCTTPRCSSPRVPRDLHPVPAPWLLVWQRSRTRGQRVASALRSCHDTEKSSRHPCATVVHPRCVQVHPWCLPTHGVPVVHGWCRHEVAPLVPPRPDLLQQSPPKPSPSQSQA